MITIDEIHILAYFYHWGATECWEMPLSKRGVFVDKIKAQLKAERKAMRQKPKS